MHENSMHVVRMSGEEGGTPMIQEFPRLLEVLEAERMIYVSQKYVEIVLDRKSQYKLLLYIAVQQSFEQANKIDSHEKS